MWKASFVVLAALVAVGSMNTMVGAPVKIDVNNESVKHVLDFSVGEHNRRSNDLFLSGVAEVLNASKQVVAGMKYVITVKMGKTPCRRNSAAEVCAVHDDPQKAQLYQCTFTVLERVWLSEIKLLREQCGERGGGSQAQRDQM